jgi:methylenetetrahydrofolate dehydrogenase (NADP+) / methenyltetrahydrofolate cyclohydrolase
MSAVLSGRELAASIRADVEALAGQLTADGVAPTLAILVATDEESTAWYVSSIAKAGDKLGVTVLIRTLDPTATTQQLQHELRGLALDDAVHGIILQTPLPEGVAMADLAGHVPIEKDVDGINPHSAGLLAAGQPAFAPATAEAVLELLRHFDIALSGRRVVVIGRSAVVGRPVAQLLLQEDATVTVAHSKSADLPALAAEADVLVVAVGRRAMVTREYVRRGTTVIDVGTNTDAAGNLVGDVDAASVADVAGGLTPVPGGVGPVTTALILKHAVLAADRQRR